MSWFTTSTLSNTLTSLASSVQSNINIDPSLLQKLTLQSPDLLSERTKIIAEQSRKERVKDSLASLLPWETRDAESEILVDECREVILGLSEREETFTGPFVLPGGFKNFNLNSTESGIDRQDEDDEEEDEELRHARDLHEAEKSSEKLSKLQPLPALLAEFDLDTHVGLIQRLLELDEKLVEVHSRLSSGGARELAFWKNYFFHCAFARYEAGLSIDEIWSVDPVEASAGDGADNGGASLFVGDRRAAVGEKNENEEFDMVDRQEDEEEEEELIFDDNLDGSSSLNTAVAAATLTQSKQSSSSVTAAAAAATTTIADSVYYADLESNVVDPADSSGGTSTSYDFVPEVSGEDGEMDELEAEIAAALGD